MSPSSFREGAHGKPHAKVSLDVQSKMVYKIYKKNISFKEQHFVKCLVFFEKPFYLGLQLYCDSN